MKDLVSQISPCVNPMTVLGFVNTAYDGGHKSMVHTAGASALGTQCISDSFAH